MFSTAYEIPYLHAIKRMLICCTSPQKKICAYCSVPGKHPLPGKCPCTAFQGVNVAVSIQMCGSYIPSKHPCGPKSRVMFKHPWALTRDTTAPNSGLHLTRNSYIQVCMHAWVSMALFKRHSHSLDQSHNHSCCCILPSLKWHSLLEEIENRKRSL